MTETEVINETYWRLGYTTRDDEGKVVIDKTCKFPEDGIKAFITLAINKIGRRLPVTSIFRIKHDGDNTRTYGLPADFLHIEEVFWATDSDFQSDLSLLPAKYGKQYSSEGADLLEMLLDLRTTDQFSNYFRHEGVDYRMVSDNSIMFLSMTSISDVAILYAKRRKNLSEFSNHYLDVFSCLIASKAIEAYISGNENTSGIQRAGGVVEYEAASSYLRLKKELDSEYWTEMQRLEKLNYMGAVQ